MWLQVSVSPFLETLSNTDVLTEYGYTNPLAKVNTCSIESKKLLYAAAAVKKTPHLENFKGRNSLFSNNKLKWAFFFLLALAQSNTNLLKE